MFGQNPLTFQCASEEIMQAHPELLMRQQSLESSLFQKNKKGNFEKSNTLPYVLPVVVHIIHDNGVGDIPDAQVFDAIEQLNNAFAHQGYYADQGNGHDTQIQFCLAKRNPDGNATNGITRTSSPLTNMHIESDDQNLKDLSRWHPNDYINIWVVNTISSQSSGSGVIGYAYLASAHGKPFDGIVCEAGYFGTSPEKDVVLIHEMGHYLNLYHTFQGGCTNDNCLTDGDRVCDTPPDQAIFSGCNFNSCDTDTDDNSANNPLATDVVDRTENYMDYSPFACYHAFTEGQVMRMHDAIEFARRSLLESKGCLEACTMPITAAFNASATEIAAGEMVAFTNLTTGGTVYEWSVNGVVFSDEMDADFTFNEVGTFKVVLNVGNDDANCLEETSILIDVKCPVVASFTTNTDEPVVGETFVASNSSQHATSFEWRINGLLISTDLDLHFDFNNDGIYTISLKAMSGFCHDAHEYLIRVKSDNPCDGFLTEHYFYQSKGQLNVGSFSIGGSIFLNSRMYPVGGGVSKYDRSGNLLWKKKFSNPTVGQGGIMSTNDGGCIVSQRLNLLPSSKLIFKLSKEGDMVWSKNIDPFQTVGGYIFPSNSSYGEIEIDGDVIVFSGTHQPDPSSVKVARITADGHIKWNKIHRLWNSKRVLPYSGVRSFDKQAKWLAGHDMSIGGYDRQVLIKLNNEGEIIFIKSYGGPYGNIASIHQIATPDNGIAWVSKLDTEDDTDEEQILVCKANQHGEIEWSKLYSSGNVQNALVVDVQDWIGLSPEGDLWMGHRTFISDDFTWSALDMDGNPLFRRRLFRDDGTQLHFRPSNKFVGGNMIVSGHPTGDTKREFIAEVNKEEGLLLSCVHFTEENFVANDFPLTSIEYTSILTSDTISITDHALPEIFFTENISRESFCNFPVPCPEICGNSLDDDEDGYVDCFDPDCQCFENEECIIDKVPNVPIIGKVDWQSTKNEVATATTPIVGNLNPQTDSIPEIIISKGSTSQAITSTTQLLIFKGDGSNANDPDQLYIPSAFNFTASPTVGDVNKDGIPELILPCNDFRIRVYTNFEPGASPCMTLMATSDAVLDNQAPHLILADFDSDGTPEVAANNDVFQFDFSDPAAPTLTRVLDGMGHSGYTSVDFRSKNSAVDLLSPSNCSGDPDCEGLELLAGTYIYSIDLDMFDGDGMQIKVKRNLNEMGPNTGFSDGYSYTADLDLNGALDVVTSGKQSNLPGTYVWNRLGLVNFFQKTDDSEHFNALAIANVFDDTKAGYPQDFPEIIALSNNTMMCYNLNVAATTPSTPYWWTINTTDDGWAGISCFDFNRDGLAEIVHRDEKQLQIIYGGNAPFPSGVASDRSWWTVDCPSPTGDEIPVIADTDGDMQAEIIFTGKMPPENTNTDPNRGRLWVVGSDGHRWPSTRPVWNQYDYLGMNINDNLSIPKQQQSHHLEFPEPGSGKQPFNAAQTQWSTWDENFEPILSLADATIQVDSSACAADSIFLRVTICNQGNHPLFQGLPVSFYNNDPTTTATTLIVTIFTSYAVPSDSCYSFSTKIPAMYNMPIYVLVNDKGTLPTPFDLANDFPNTNIGECNYENNMAQFSTPYQSPTLDLGPDIITCNSNTTTLDAGNGFAKYKWQDGSEDSIFTAWGIGKYWVDAWDACGFKHTDTVIISLDQATVFDLGEDRVICEGETVNLSINSFSEVQWWPADGLSCIDCPTVNATPIASVTYHATGTEGDCFSSDSIRITIVPPSEISLLTPDINCSEPAILTAESDDGALLDYIWSNGEIGSSIEVIQSGTYSVTATNSAGCQVVDSIFVDFPHGIVFSTNIIDIPCFGGTGSISLEITQAALPYNVLWSNSSTTDTVAGLPAGQYSVTITDAAGCEVTEGFILENPAELTLSATVSNIFCNDIPGSIALHAIGGTGPFSYAWSNDLVSDSISVQTPGDYSATVTDGNGCTATIDLTIEEEEPLSASILFTEIQCHGGMDGSAELIPLNGTAPYSYLWENGQTDSIRNGLGSEPHSVTIVDALGCIKEIEFSLLEPDSLSIGFSALPVLCFGEMNGSITALVSGGSPDYSYLWNTGATSPSIDNLQSAPYHLTITDNNGCQDSASYLLEDPPFLQATIAATPSEVCPNETGDLSAIPMGGTPPYTYLWSNMSMDSFLANVPSGMYEVLVSDSNGCEANSEIVLEEISPPITVQDTIIAATGATISNGAILLGSIVGGTPPFNFLWSNGDTSQSITELLPGIYSLTITDTEGCSETFEFEVGIMVGIKHSLHQGFEVSLFPNPAPQKGYGILSAKTNSHQSLKLQLYDMTGRLLRRETIRALGGQSYQKISTPEVAGVYLLRIVGENGQHVFLRWVVSGR